jgi:hypothetical protein
VRAKPKKMFINNGLSLLCCCKVVSDLGSCYGSPPRGVTKQPD